MLRVALTGGIATGKSYVLSRLRERGVPTIDADDIVHEVLGPERQRHKAIATQFGGAFLKPDGSVDRSLLGAKVFGDADSRCGSKQSFIRSSTRPSARWYERLDRQWASPRFRCCLKHTTKGISISSPSHSARRTCSCSGFSNGRNHRGRSAAADRRADAGRTESAARGLRHPDRRHASTRLTARSMSC